MKPRRTILQANSFGIIFGPSSNGKFVEGRQIFKDIDSELVMFLIKVR